jgi:hypothetical protein
MSHPPRPRRRTCVGRAPWRRAAGTRYSVRSAGAVDRRPHPHSSKSRRADASERTRRCPPIGRREAPSVVRNLLIGSHRTSLSPLLGSDLPIPPQQMPGPGPGPPTAGGAPQPRRRWPLRQHSPCLRGMPPPLSVAARIRQTPRRSCACLVRPDPFCRGASPRRLPSPSSSQEPGRRRPQENCGSLPDGCCSSSSNCCCRTFLSFDFPSLTIDVPTLSGAAAAAVSRSIRRDDDLRQSRVVEEKDKECTDRYSSTSIDFNVGRKKPNPIPDPNPRFRG